jgi:hypothetical protein
MRKHQQKRMSSPKTSQTLTKQQHPHGMLVRFNLLSLKQIEKAPAITGLSLFEATNGAQLLCLDKFGRNPFRMTFLQTKTPLK